MTAKNGQLYQLSLTGVLGGLMGVFVTRLFGANRLNPDDILEQVKRQFRQESPIEGAWIEKHAVPFQKFAVKSRVYYGGINRYEDDQLVQYQFVADAETGSVLDIHRL
ncbi:PepSY domain-containing protein [Levilactobacillus lanxiensis]|jgi:predicted small secreted protein|uniref:PepSY domain-containing protein n=1 Tax=Levilactobacillus lanxiensis TaxID=2799568 RepID=A0ABW4D4Z3_9LACO|nr:MULTISPECIES: PepSY domain-containing protein [Levilactobacillus]